MKLIYMDGQGDTSLKGHHRGKTQGDSHYFFNLPDEQRYGTISGFVMLMLGHVPKTGDFFTWNGYEFKVTKMKNHRVNRLQLHLKDSSL